VRLNPTAVLYGWSRLESAAGDVRQASASERQGAHLRCGKRCAQAGLLRSTPLVSMVQATNLRSLHNAPYLRGCTVRCFQEMQVQKSRKPCRMPRHHRLGPYDDQGSAPVLPALGETHPEQAIRLTQPGSRAVTLEEGECWRRPDCPSPFLGDRWAIGTGETVSELSRTWGLSSKSRRRQRQLFERDAILARNNIKTGLPGVPQAR
jgi:hypothetical protein